MLADFFDGFKLACQARGFTGPVLLGKRWLAGQDDPTAGRIVCVLGRDTVGPTTRVGGNPRSRATRNAALEIHVWGALAITAGVVDDVQSLRNTESLVQLAINAIRDNATGTSEVSDVDWGQSEETPIMRASYLATISMTVEVPVVDTTYGKSPSPPNQPVPVLHDYFTLNGHHASGPECGAEP